MPHFPETLAVQSEKYRPWSGALVERRHGGPSNVRSLSRESALKGLCGCARAQVSCHALQAPAAIL